MVLIVRLKVLREYSVLISGTRFFLRPRNGGRFAGKWKNSPKRSERFYAAIRKYWPGLPDGALAPGYAGIRPKTAGPKEPAPDFEVQGPSVHGVPGLVHLFGIESPGLSASLALAGIVLRELS